MSNSKIKKQDASESTFPEEHPTQESDQIFAGLPEGVRMHTGFMERQKAYVVA
jgi:hypothetical protein